jgi:endonuclease G
MEKTTKYLFLVVAIISFAAGIAFQYAFMTYLWPNRHQTYSWIYTLRNHRKPGEPCETDKVLDRQGYSLGYSYEHKAALWVSYVISEGSIGVDIGRHSSFYPDRDIPEEYRTQPEDYLNTGYDKGHQAPSAAIDFSKNANRETFALSNVTLQEPELNRQAWGKLEDLVRDWTKTKGKLYVITGPLYSSKPKKVNGIPVPSKFYKVIYSYDADKAIGFIFPNKPVENENLWRYAMSVQEVEEKTGLKFFSKFKEKKQKTLKETFDKDWWKEN